MDAYPVLLASLLALAAFLTAPLVEASIHLLSVRVLNAKFVMLAVNFPSLLRLVSPPSWTLSGSPGVTVLRMFVVMLVTFLEV